MRPLERLLHARIRDEGPITVADYMALCLGHPVHGYYTTRDPFGAAGDFTTAPEIGQVFGELLGLWAAQVWLDAGAPTPVRLIEIGPGRGTLMRDALRAMARVPGLRGALSVHLVETSPALTAIQRETLGGEPGIAWHRDLAAVPDGPVLLLANELFDALPIRQFVFARGAWHERLVGSDGDRFGFGLRAEPTPLSSAPEDPPEGALWEEPPARISLAAEIGARVAKGGAALLIDYGHAEPGFGDTLQAVRGHAFAPVLEAPGEADLTSHVDFASLASAAAAAGARPHGPLEQGALLTMLGIDARTQALARANPDRADALLAARDRLVAPDQMGRLFKALALTAPGSSTPPGFA
ncbi:MAG: SAM-dependent methyltransferase [Pseudomonadota bacterium]